MYHQILHFLQVKHNPDILFSNYEFMYCLHLVPRLTELISIGLIHILSCFSMSGEIIFFNHRLQLYVN
ncbi:unnamed protein product [Heterobilharzia americana]|nr:unnamed protein product [Heterobilharzia americana]